MSVRVKTPMIAKSTGQSKGGANDIDTISHETSINRNEKIIIIAFNVYLENINFIIFQN